MAKYLKLLEFELKRARPFVLTLVLIVIIGESLIFGFLYQQSIQYNRSYTFMQFFDHNGLYYILLAAIMMAVFIYALYIWFREWRNDGKFIYRLATLPGSRLPIALAKLTTIALIIFSLILLQQIIFRVVNELIVATGINEHKYWVDMFTSQYNSISSILMPSSFTVFLSTYLFGFSFLALVTNSLILFLCEYRVKFWLTIIKIIIFTLVSLLIMFGLFLLLYVELQILERDRWLENILLFVYFLSQIAVMKYLLDHRLNV